MEENSAEDFFSLFASCTLKTRFYTKCNSNEGWNVERIKVKHFSLWQLEDSSGEWESRIATGLEDLASFWCFFWWKRKSLLMV